MRGNHVGEVVVMRAAEHNALDVLAVVGRENIVDHGLKLAKSREIQLHVTGERGLRRDDDVSVVPFFEEPMEISLLGGAAGGQHQDFAVRPCESGRLYGRLHAHERRAEFAAEVGYAHARGGIASRDNDFRALRQQELAHFFRSAAHIPVAAVAVGRVAAVENVDKVLAAQPLDRRPEDFQSANAAVEYSYCTAIHNHIIFVGAASGYGDGDIT